jgi:predicted TIM-barrel fold metal-dependent hydrolase
MTGDAKGEYRGTGYRNDAELQAWLAKRPSEAALEQGLPIIDPHHHFWDTPQRGRYLLPELLDDLSGGHNIVSTVFLECRSMYRKDGPAEIAPVGEVEFVNGIAAMSASGGYGPCRVAEAIIGHADLTLGARVREVLETEIRVGSGRFRGIRHGVSWDSNDSIQKFATRVVPPHLVRDPKFREGFAQLAPLGLSFESWQYHPQLPDAIDLARAFPGTTIILNHVGGVLGVGPYSGPPPGDLDRLEEGHRRTRQMPERQCQARRRRHDLIWVRLPRARCPAVVRRPRRGVAPIYRALHRSFRPQPLHVREQFPAGQAIGRLHRAVECLQTHHRQRVGRRKDRALQRHCGAGVPSDGTLIRFDSGAIWFRCP